MNISRIDDFLSYVDSVRGRTRRVVQTIPADRIEWTHREGSFTLGGLVRHIGSTERYMFAETARGNPSTYPGHGRDLADGYDAVLAYLDRTHAEALDIYRSLGPETLAGRCTTPAGTSITDLEVAPRHGRARDPSSRTALSHAQHDRRPNSSALRPHRRAAS